MYIFVQLTFSRFVQQCVFSLPACVLFRSRTTPQVIYSFPLMRCALLICFQYIYLSQQCCHGHFIQSPTAQASYFFLQCVPRPDFRVTGHAYLQTYQIMLDCSLIEVYSHQQRMCSLHFFTSTQHYQTLKFGGVKLFFIVVLILIFLIASDVE